MRPEKKLAEKANFEMLRYANCWEDADTLLKALKPEPGSSIISIASAGDNSFSLLTTNPTKVIAVDINPAQLHLVELKKICFQKLEYDKLLEFIGCKDDKYRKETYQKFIRPGLGKEALNYWDHNLTAIAKGIIFCGKFEKYFHLFSKMILPLIHSKSVVKELFKIKTREEQQHFYHKKWNTTRWKSLFKIFFSRFVMGRIGRDPALMKEVKISVKDFIFNKAESHLSSVLAQKNPYLEFILTGNFKKHLPHYLREENFELIRNHVDKLEIYNGYLEDIIEKEPFQYLNLSNIFEYMNPGAFTKLALKIHQYTPKGGRIAYWNLMVPRQVSTVTGTTFYYDEKECNLLRETDKGFFYDKIFAEHKS